MLRCRAPSPLSPEPEDEYRLQAGDRGLNYLDPGLSLQSPANSDQFHHSSLRNESADSAEAVVRNDAPALHTQEHNQYIQDNYYENENGLNAAQMPQANFDCAESLASVTAISLCPEFGPISVGFGQSITAGRFKESNFHISDNKVSQHHFTIRHNFLSVQSDTVGSTCAGCFLEDHSRNGTWLRRGSRRWLLRGTRAALHDGDVVSLVRPYRCPSHDDTCLGNHAGDPEGCMLRFGDRPTSGILAIRFEIRAPRSPKAGQDDPAGIFQPSFSAGIEDQHTSPEEAAPTPTRPDTRGLSECGRTAHAAESLPAALAAAGGRVGPACGEGGRGDALRGAA